MRTVDVDPDGRTNVRRERRHGPPPHLRRSDGKTPCPGHSLDQSKSDQTPAGLLAHGSSLDVRPSQASHYLASGPVAGGGDIARTAHVHRARRLQLQGQPRIRMARAFRTAFPIKSLSGHRRDQSAFERFDDLRPRPPIQIMAHLCKACDQRPCHSPECASPIYKLFAHIRMR